MPTCHGGLPGRTTEQTMSPPAERQKSVPSRSRRKRAARSTAQPLTTPVGSKATVPSEVGRNAEKAPPESRSACSAMSSTAVISAGAWSRVSSRRRSREATESERHSENTRSTQRRSVTTSAHAASPAGVTAWRPRSARLTGMPISCSIRRTIRLGSAYVALERAAAPGHSPASSRAAWSDSR